MRLVSNMKTKLKSNIAQSTVEAAFLIPVLLTLVLLLVQPAIVLYDLIVMKSASSEACRLLSEPGSAVSGSVEDFIRRRLSAVPQIDSFHVHNSSCSWEITLVGEGQPTSTVAIKNKIKPLPIIDIALKSLSVTTSEGELELCATSTQDIQPQWAREQGQ